MKNRTKENWRYYLEAEFIREEEFCDLQNKATKLAWELGEKRRKRLDISVEKEKYQKLTEKILSSQEKELPQKNILSFANFDDKKIWNWQDSSVYEIQNNDKYVYKESFKGEYENYLYLKNKYLLLKKYLWDIIPKSYFAFWEWLTRIDKTKVFKKSEKPKYVSDKIFTIQRKIKWKDFSKLSKEEKFDEKLLLELENAHRKYVLLKLFLNKKLQNLGFSRKTMDIQLDLWYLSKKDDFSINDLEFIEKNVTSPNIMWDSKKIYFIDYGFWTWDEDKQKIFDYMMDEKTFNSWNEILKEMDLK